MRKLICLLAFAISFAGVANAQSIVVIDENGVVTKQIYTQTNNTNTQSDVPAVTVVRESPKIYNSYYYDKDSTRNAMIAGITTAVVGGLIYDGFHHHRKHLQKPHKLHNPKPKNFKPHKFHNPRPKNFKPHKRR